LQDADEDMDFALQEGREGAAPLLQKFHSDASDCNEDDQDSIADMLETRALIPSCKKFESLEGIGNDHWFDEATLETEIRLLRAMLPFTKVLPALTWESAFEPCFIEAPAPYLTRIEVALQGDRGVFSWKVFEAAPALVSILIGCVNQIPNGTTALQSALRNGALQKLEEMAMINFEDVRDFAIALTGSGCAKRLTCFPFIHYDLTDVCVVALAEALLKATQTFWTHLNLSDVGMGDEGIAALAPLVSQGRMQQVTELSLSGNSGLTKQGIITLAEAIDARGLPKLRASHLSGLLPATDEESILGITTFVHAVTKGCPPLKEFTFDPTHQDVITDMIKAAGWKREVNMHKMREYVRCTGGREAGRDRMRRNDK